MPRVTQDVHTASKGGYQAPHTVNLHNSLSPFPKLLVHFAIFHLFSDFPIAGDYSPFLVSHSISNNGQWKLPAVTNNQEQTIPGKPEMKQFEKGQVSVLTLNTAIKHHHHQTPKHFNLKKN